MVWMQNFLNILILSPSNIENEEAVQQIVANPFDGQKSAAGVLLYEQKHTLNILLYESLGPAVNRQPCFRRGDS